MVRRRRDGLLQSVSRALAVLEALAERPMGVTPKRLSSDLGLPLSTVYHQLNTLCHAGYAVQDPTSRLFRIGPRIPWLNRAFLESLSVPSWIGHFVQLLRDATGETAALAQWWGNCVACTLYVEGTRPQRVTGGYEGIIFLPTEVAAGRVLLAWACEDRLQACLKVVRRPGEYRALCAELQQIRERGYAVERDHGGRKPSVCCVAAPVVGADGEVAQALTILGGKDRFNQDEESLVRTVVSIARAASAVAAERDANWPGDETSLQLRPPVWKTALDATLNAALKAASNGAPRRRASD